MHMTADGMVLRTCRCTDVTVAMGDRVKLWNGWTGYAHNWTEGGIMLRLDHACRPFVGRLLVLAIEVGDGDIESVEQAPLPMERDKGCH